MPPDLTVIDSGSLSASNAGPVALAHRESVTASVQEVAGFLAELLSRRVTAFLAGVTNGKTVARWATGEITEIRDPQSEQRLRTAYEIARLLLTAESPQTVRAWFIGLNPHLDDTSPAEAIHEGRFRDALAAARAFLAAG